MLPPAGGIAQGFLTSGVASIVKPYDKINKISVTAEISGTN